MYFVGNCYKDGEGVTKDLNKAIEWRTKAAAHGVQQAQVALNDIN